MNDSKLNILIGRNGSGKSRFLASILKHYLKNKSYQNYFGYRRIVAISITPFDKFPVRVNDKNNVYRYLGIKDSLGNNAAKKFVQKIAADFFEALDRHKSFDELFEAFSHFNLKPWIKFDFKISSRIDLRIAANSDEVEFSNYIFNEFLGSDLWQKVSPINKTKDVFGAIKELQYIINHKNLVKKEAVRWSLDFDCAPEYWSNNGLGYKSLSILISSGLVDISKIYIEIKGKVFDLCTASSGEQSIYLTLIALSANIKDETLVLIDEPETCLHPAWQEKYISMIEVFRRNYRNCSFWIATHSPRIVSGADSNANIIDFENNKNYPNGEFSKKSADYQLAELFNSPGYKNEYISRKVLDLIEVISARSSLSQEIEEKFLHILKLMDLTPSDDPLRDVVGVIEASLKERKNHGSI